MMEPLSNSVKDKMLRAEVENSNLQTSTSRYLHKMMQNMPSVQEDQVEVEQNDVVAISELLDFVNQNIETLFVEFSKNEELHKLEQTIRAKSTYPDLLAAIDSYNGHFPVKKPTATGSLGANGATIVPMDDQDEDSRQKAMSGAQSFARELTNLYLHVKNLYDHDTKIVDLEHSTRVESGPMQIYSFFPDTLLDFIGQNTHLFNKNIDPNNIKEEDVPCVHFKGCCMLADISGFSKFSGEMCAQGLSGLDKLTEVTNGFLGDYVKIVYQYRGDVIAFAGDALICLFREEPDLYESSTLSPNCCTRALQCSKVLQHLKTDRLSTHLAISFGEMKIALLGGVDDKWAYIMNGGCIAEIGAAVDYAKAEETACTQACFEHSEKGRKAAMTGEFASLVREDKEEFKLTFEKVGPPSETFQIYKLKDVTDCQELKQFSRRKSVQLTSSRIGVFKKASRTLEIVARFIPSPVLAAVCNDSLGDISELRQVTTIFLSLDSYDPIKHQDPRSLQPFFTISQQLLLETGGFLRQFLVDDKGCVLIAMWGVPSVSYSNNTVRAVYFAVNLRKRAEKEIGLMCSIGVTTGSVFCGWVGSTTRRDYAGVGTQVNVAARLMCKAKGRVLIDPDSYRNLDPMTKAQCTAAESLVLKGIAYPVIPHYFNLDLEPSMSNVKKPAITGALYTLKASIKKIIEKDILQFSRAPPTKDSFEKNFDKPKSKLQHKPAARSRKERQLLIVVAGPSGSGKGMVAGHFKDGLEKKKLVVISLKCRSTQKSHQYGLVKELLMEIIGHEKFAKDSTGGKDVIHELVQGACQYFTEDEKEHSRSRLRFILDVEVDGEDLSIHRKPNPTDDIIPRMLSYLLRNNAQTAIVIEDAHSCDEVSWNELYNILLKKEISIMILITVKSIDQEKVLSSIVQMCMSDFESPTVKLATDGLASAEKKSNAYNKKVDMNIDLFGGDDDEFVAKKKAPDGILAMIDRDKCTSIDMSGLNDSQVKEIVAAKLQTNNVSQDLLKLVMDLSSGNAFWCEAIAEFLEEKGIEDFEEEMKSNIEHKDQALQTIIVCRIEKLSALHQYVLKYASVIGIEFNQKILQSILPAKYGKDLNDTMNHLSEGGFVVCMEESAGSSVYEFSNPIIQSTVYELLPRRLLNEIHVYVAKATEEHYNKAIAQFYPFLAYHFGMNQSTASLSFKYKLKAADQAIALGAYSDGIHNIKEAHPLATTMPEFNICNALLENLMLDINDEIDEQRKICKIDKMAEEDDMKMQLLTSFKEEVEEIVAAVLVNLEKLPKSDLSPEDASIYSQLMPDWTLTYLNSQAERIRKSKNMAGGGDGVGCGCQVM